jgi:four helix bundle protein
MASITHFRDLKAWQVSRELRNGVRLLVRSWPADERYRLTDQIIRSSRSVTANIAEGYGRFYERENIRFCRMARGSLYETQDHLITAQDEGSSPMPSLSCISRWSSGP